MSNSRSASGDCAALVAVAHLERTVEHGLAAGQELDGRGIGGRLGLDEHSVSPRRRFKAGQGLEWICLMKWRVFAAA